MKNVMLAGVDIAGLTVCAAVGFVAAVEYSTMVAIGFLIGALGFGLSLALNVFPDLHDWRSHGILQCLTFLAIMCLVLGLVEKAVTA